MLESWVFCFIKIWNNNTAWSPCHGHKLSKLKIISELLSQWYQIKIINIIIQFYNIRTLETWANRKSTTHLLPISYQGFFLMNTKINYRYNSFIKIWRFSEQQNFVYLYTNPNQIIRGTVRLCNSLSSRDCLLHFRNFMAVLE